MPRTSARATALLLALISAVLLPTATAGGQAAEKRLLQDARDRLEAVAREIQAAEDVAQGAEAALADADERLRAVEAVVYEVAETLDLQRAAVTEAARRLAAVEEQAILVRQSFSERAAAAYKQGSVRNLELLLTSGGADEALDRTTYLAALTLRGAATTESLAAAEVAVAMERERLQNEETQLERMLAEQKQLFAQAERLRDSRALAAANARQELEGLAAQHDDLEEESDRLEDLVQQLQAQDRGRAPAVSAAGGYAWAICAPVTSDYGRRWGRMHQGIDLGAGTGTPIAASKAGTIIFAGWHDGGFGNLVMIDHGDGVVTAYAHQSRVAVSRGATVSQGTTIGYVGSTGNSTGPHLHQEFRVNGSTVNPRQYLSGSQC